MRLVGRRCTLCCDIVFQKKQYKTKDNVISLENPDVLTGLLRLGARGLITFSTILLRTKKTRAFASKAAILTVVYKLGLIAEKRWRKLRGFRRCHQWYQDLQLARKGQLLSRPWFLVLILPAIEPD